MRKSCRSQKNHCGKKYLVVACSYHSVFTWENWLRYSRERALHSLVQGPYPLSLLCLDSLFATQSCASSGGKATTYRVDKKSKGSMAENMNRSDRNEYKIKRKKSMWWRWTRLATAVLPRPSWRHGLPHRLWSPADGTPRQRRRSLHERRVLLHLCFF